MTGPARRADLQVGDTTVTYVPDGHGWLDPAATFPASQPHGWDVHDSYLREDGRFVVSIGSFLIRTPGHAVLVDLGIGAVDFEVPGLAEFHGGELLANLAAEGLAPSDIDTVVFTHLHHDHVGWTTNLAPAPNATTERAPDGLTFPRARHLVGRDEWTHWHGTDDPVGPHPLWVQAPLEGVVELVDDGDVVAPGVRVTSTPGHTPGHLSLLVEDPAEPSPGVLVLGDVMHSQVQVAEHGWSFVFDHDPVLAGKTRERVLGEAQETGVRIAGGHFADHVFGTVRAATATRAWAGQR
ncbi:MBL fold metallo-hydrolase [Luteipulveratus mongoliensis]|uniref:Beta-lactamase n=1 Tax=Luteipulveratus mongoliensis TaxID=571913 RepID=A0A0K1JFB0_9MICO|nr:MBL fold metallo-hydrolase [Luteipulveratus mongoliensis]AKU15412.1 beta-lactamase [Luteipulveratus mongoliensis]